MQPITISDVQISFPEFRRLNQQLMLRQRWWVYVLALAYPLYTTWRPTASDVSSSFLFKAGMTAFFLLIVGGTYVYSTRVLLKRTFDKTPLYQQPFTFTLSEAGIALTSPLQRSTISWNTVKGVRRLGQWYILATDSQQGMLLDSTRIQAPSGEEDLRAALQQHNIRFL